MSRNLFTNTKGQASPFPEGRVWQKWIFGLVTIFGLGIIFRFVFGLAIKGNFLPQFKNIASSSTTMDAASKASVLSGIDFTVTMIGLSFIILIFGAIVFMFVSVFRKETEEY